MGALDEHRIARPGGRRVAAWGALAALAYLAAAAVTFEGRLLPVRPLYDGTAPPQPYQWVDPPPEFAETNVPAEGAEQRVDLNAEGSIPTSVTTADGQAVIVLNQSVFPPKDGQTAVLVKVTPLDPDTVGAPPRGMRYDGNAYRFEASYLPSGDPAEITQKSSLLLRFPVHATELARRDGDRWARVGGRALPSLQIFTDVEELGTFVAIAPEGTGGGEGGGSSIAIIAAVAAVAAGAAGLVLGRRAGRGKAKGKGARPGKGKAKGAARGARGAPKGKGGGKKPPPSTKGGAPGKKKRR